MDITNTDISPFCAVADPGFSRGGAPIPKLGLFCNFIAENCMKMKEFGRGGGTRVPGAPLDPTNVVYQYN